MPTDGETGTSTLAETPEVKRGFELGCCSGIIRLSYGSLMAAEGGIGETSWTHQYLGSCPYCDESYPWMRPLAGGD